MGLRFHHFYNGKHEKRKNTLRGLSTMKWTFTKEPSQAQTLHRYAFVYNILHEIDNGKRLHLQESYHSVVSEDSNVNEYMGNTVDPEYDCNTAHCIAGWMIYDFHKNQELEFDYEYGSIFYSGITDENHRNVRMEPKRTIPGTSKHTDYYEYLIYKYLVHEDGYLEQTGRIVPFKDIEAFCDSHWAWATVFLGITYEQSEGLFDAHEELHDIIDHFLDLAYNLHRISKEDLENEINRVIQES